MTIKVTLADIKKLAPNAKSDYLTAFSNGQPLLDHYGISNNALRLSHFMAQILEECSGLTTQYEDLYYSAKRLPQVWPTRFKPRGKFDPVEYAGNPRKLANLVYGDRMGNNKNNDGYTYRGRGLLQLTGKNNYGSVTTLLHKSKPDAPNLISTPDAVISAEWCLVIAAVVWDSKGCNALADADNITKVTEAINGGQIGLDERIAWLKRTKAVWAH